MHATERINCTAESHRFRYDPPWNVSFPNGPTFRPYRLSDFSPQRCCLYSGPQFHTSHLIINIPSTTHLELLLVRQVDLKAPSRFWLQDVSRWTLPNSKAHPGWSLSSTPPHESVSSHLFPPLWTLFLSASSRDPEPDDNPCWWLLVWLKWQQFPMNMALIGEIMAEKNNCGSTACRVSFC